MCYVHLIQPCMFTHYWITIAPMLECMIISMHVDIYIQRHSRILIIQLNKLEASKHVTN